MKFLIVGLMLIGLSSCDSLVNENCVKLKPHWESYPVHYSIDNSVPERYRKVIEESADAWNQRFNKSLLVLDNKSDNKIYWIAEDWASLNFPQNYLAVTSSWSEGRLFTNYKVRINADHYTFYIKNDDEQWGRMHFKSVMMHEFGHVIGLDHTQYGVMKPGISSNREITSLSNLDCSL